MLQVYLVRYDCFKIQQLIPNRIFCILFYAICIIDLILLLFSCSFFILPFQQEDFEQQFIIEKETIDWSQNLYQKQFGQYSIFGELNNEEVSFILNHYDPYLDTNNTTYFQKINFHEFFGYVDYKLAHLMRSKTYCLQLYILKQKTQKFIKKLPYCNKSNGIPISPWYWKGEKLYILTEICLKLSIKEDKLYFEQGCFQDGFIYKELIDDETANFENLSLYLRHNEDPYLHGIKISREPIKSLLQLSQIYYSFLFGISGTIYMILIYFILSLRKRSEIQYV